MTGRSYCKVVSEREKNLTQRTRAEHRLRNAAARRWRKWRLPGCCAIARVTSALIGARNVAQLDDSLDALKNLHFSNEELKTIDDHAREGDIDIWKDAREKMD